MRTHGFYPKKWPQGAVVHFTAGRDGALKTIQGGVKDGYAYWCIQKNGELWCAHSANEWGYHAGSSGWKKRLLGGVSDDLIGIEINAAGRVDPLPDGTFRTWFKTILHSHEVRYSDGKDGSLKGWYEKYTPEQEHTLVETLMWLKAQKPYIFDFDLVLGHDEVAGPLGIGYFRKNDPGAALSMSKDAFRAQLKKEWAARNPHV